MTSWSCLIAAKVFWINVTSLRRPCFFLVVFFDGVFTVQPKQEWSKHTVRNTRLCRSVTSCPITYGSGHTQQTLSPPGHGQTAPFDLGSACSHGTCWGSVGGSLYLPSLPGRINHWSVKAAQRQDSYQMKGGGGSLSSPPPLPSTATWPKAMRIPLKNPRIYLIILCSQITFHGYQVGIRLFHTVLPFGLCWYKILLKSMGKL